jgi:ribosome biogenesis GTPase A
VSLHGGMTLKKFLEKLTGKKSVRTESRPNTVKQKEFFKRNRFLMKKKILDISYKAQRKIVDVIRSIFYPYKTSVAYHLNPIVDVIWDEKDYIDKRLTNSLDYLQAFSEYSDWAINAKDLLNSTDIYIKKLGLREVENENT